MGGIGLTFGALFLILFSGSNLNDTSHSQAVFMIPPSGTIVLFKLSCQYLRQEPRGLEELVSRQLLKSLHQRGNV